ncbi:methionine ABC transporter permease [Enterocloster clostridioformis]|uniref:methionine ABC transporter permease n=1 Tax=Enterocloster clostridioformis TaxID=1531 RepID=UPI00080CA290|nr:methionine ABC transporter permease [Enterocloster clostridioformis]ANU49946.1 methionine ABC transporter permease [Lachnoclostridium sp. YL32]NDO28566.1 ABC transporter permease [Enterocloster clostridioformis]OXE70994.1 methionine ABC transporter permease [Enterocloster clostridioformis]QQR01150.1 ABC transporter permease [Enterocloster clostridioformis]
MQFDSTTINMLVKGIWETIYMVFLSSALSYVIGIPLGIALVVTDKEGISPVPLFNKVLGLVINLLRSVPFIILLIMVLPITKFIVGKTIGSNATVVPLIIAASPYIGRMVESSLKEVDAGVIEAAKSMGASTWQIIVKVLLPEAKPSLLVGAAISVTTILGYSAMAGFTGGGGLGDIAIRYGYHRYQTDMMMVTVVLLVIIVQLIQEVAMRMSRKSDKRIR